MSLLPDQFVKMEPMHDSAQIESIGFCENTKRLYVKMRGTGAPTLCFSGVPRFRITGLMSAARKDEYFKNFIRGTFMHREVKELPGQH
ncbi:MAG TPA: KTSC domain-containing protein [Verrucomicrobiae bacterium]|jgi:hypothetical protein